MSPSEPLPPTPTIPAIPAGAFAPPTAPGRLSIPDRPAQWPSVIGIVSIVLGSVGSALSLIKLAYYALVLAGVLDNIFATIPTPTGQPSPFGALQNHLGVIAASEALTLAIGVMLLLAGVWMLRRQPRSVLLTHIWAVLKIVVTLVGTAIGVWIQQETFNAMMNQPNMPASTAAVMPGFMIAGAIIGAVFTIALFCAWPVFLLIWLHRPSVKAEIARWRSPSHRSAF